MSEGKEPLDIVMEYFGALRTEIVEAQKLRVQVGLAKIVFLGSLLGFFLRYDKNNGPAATDNAAILICPFVALMFDFMVYGLSFNIRDIGGYIREHLEINGMTSGFAPGTFRGFKLWQTYRKDREKAGHRDWGRGMFRAGSYGLSILVAVVSFFQVTHPPTRSTPLLPLWRLIVLASILTLGWVSLIWLEFPWFGKRLAVVGAWARRGLPLMARGHVQADTPKPCPATGAKDVEPHEGRAPEEHVGSE